MERLRTGGKLQISISPMYNAPKASITICFLNARSLHKHINDIRADLNYLSTDLTIFAETRFCHTDSNPIYTIPGTLYFKTTLLQIITKDPMVGLQYTIALIIIWIPILP